jgi:S-adenosylmethionine/arginine decarboxylase-like enzyme
MDSYCISNSFSRPYSIKTRTERGCIVEYKTFGRHVLADIWGVDFNKINDIEFLKEHMYKAAEKSGAKDFSNSI